MVLFHTLLIALHGHDYRVLGKTDGLKLRKDIDITNEMTYYLLLSCTRNVHAESKDLVVSFGRNTPLPLFLHVFLDTGTSDMNILE